MEPLPADTRAIVQSVSAIGLKYLRTGKGHVEPDAQGRARRSPSRQTREPVDIDQLFNMFDKKTRTANQVNLNNFGDGLAGRGLGLNETIATLRPLVTNAIPVLHNLASPQTGLRELFVALDRVAEQVAPVADEQAAFFSELDTFFTALASVAPSLEQAIEGGPPALRPGDLLAPLRGAVHRKEHRVHAPAASEREASSRRSPRRSATRSPSAPSTCAPPPR